LEAARILAAISLALALICVALALAWTREHRAAACWREAAELDLQPDRCGP